MQEISPNSSKFVATLPIISQKFDIKTVLFCRLVSKDCAYAIHSCKFWEGYVLNALQGRAETATVYRLAKLLLNVRGNADQLGLDLMLAALKQQHPPAFFDLGLIALNKYKISKRKSLSQNVAFVSIFCFLKKASELGHTEAQFQYGKFLLENGALQGAYILLEAGRKAHTSAQSILGMIDMQNSEYHENGIYLLKLAAKRGDVKAFIALANEVGWREKQDLEDSLENIHFRFGMFLARKSAKKKGFPDCFAYDEASAKALLGKQFPFFASFPEVLLGFYIKSKAIVGITAPQENRLLEFVKMNVKMSSNLVILFLAKGDIERAVHYFHKLANHFDSELESCLPRKFLDCSGCKATIELVKYYYPFHESVLRDEFCKLLRNSGNETEIGETLAVSIFASHNHDNALRDADLNWAKKTIKSEMFFEPSDECAVSFLVTLNKLTKNQSASNAKDLQNQLNELQSLSSPLKRSLLNMEI